MVIAACIGGLEFRFPALFVDTFNTFEVYTSHRLYGATMIVNAIIVYAMRSTHDILELKEKENKKLNDELKRAQAGQKKAEDEIKSLKSKVQELNTKIKSM